MPMFDEDLGCNNERVFVGHIFYEVVKDKLVSFLKRMESEFVENKEIVSGNLVEFFEVSTVGLVVE